MPRKIYNTMSSNMSLGYKSSIKLSPREVIRFVSKYSSYYLSEDIVLVNKGPDSIMYKIKSNTKSRRYRLSTTTGIIQGHAGLRIQIILDSAEANNIANDVIVVETQYCNSDEISSDDDLQLAMRRFHEKQKGVADKKGVSFRLRCVLDVGQTENDFVENGHSQHSNLFSPNCHTQKCNPLKQQQQLSQKPQPPLYNTTYPDNCLPPSTKSSKSSKQNEKTTNDSNMCLGDNYVQYRRITEANKTTNEDEINSVFEAISSYVARKHNLRINWTNVLWGVALVCVVYAYNTYTSRRDFIERLAEQAEARASNEGWLASFFKGDSYDD